MTYIDTVIDLLDEQMPGQERDLLRLYALLVLSKGLKTNLADVHDAWSIWKNETNKEHRSLIPFEDLRYDVQQLDLKYMNIIHNVWRTLGLPDMDC